MHSTILIVDDTLKNIQLAANVLRSDPDYTILYATNGEDALKMVAEKRVHLILLDIMMPGMDGYEVARRLKASETTAELPIIFLSANNDPKSIDRGFETGGADYISKPFIANELRNRVRTHLELFHARAALRSELDEQRQLLEQYKKVVDESNIVSKTDTEGTITYVNQKFCDISQYSAEELIGNKHNIIRHDDIPNSVYRELWKTIRDKKIWRGTVKNRRKDGTPYYIQAVIMPILDKEGNITEYISSRHDVTEIYELQNELNLTQKEVLYTLGELGETRSKETGDHVRRVAEISYLLARAYGLSEHESELLRSASPMHDIGKVAIPDSILLKPGRLDEGEWEIMQRHAVLGYEVFKVSERPLLKAAATIAHEHHEKWDGSGYPRGLKGEEIHIYGRITAIADVFDALRSDRIYKKAWSCNAALELIKSERGGHFDPTLVDLFFEHLDEIQAAWQRFGDEQVSPS